MVGVWVVCSKVDIWWSSNFLKNHRFLPKTRSDLTGGTAASVSGPIPKVVVDQSGAADGNMLNPVIPEKKKTPPKRGRIPECFWDRVLLMRLSQTGR